MHSKRQVEKKIQIEAKKDQRIKEIRSKEAKSKRGSGGGKGDMSEEDAQALLGSLLQMSGSGGLSHLHGSIVKVYCIHTDPNYSLPWQMKHQESSTSSGFVIEGKRILTNAHSVEHHSQVKVRRKGFETKFIATVLCVGRECDLALLKVEDEEFWKDIEPIKFGELPDLQEAVTVIGYPIGGDNLSVTQGVVSRIDMQEYAHGGTELLAVQIDAAINPGNSGGPVFNDDGLCLGIAFQSLRDSETENIGYIIPTLVIDHFLNDYEKNKKYTDFPSAGFQSEVMENPTLRKYFKMGPKHTGILVKRITPVSHAFEVLKVNDVILAIDGIKVANDGTVPYRTDERIGASFLISQKFCGDSCAFHILRDGKEMDVEIKLTQPSALVPLQPVTYQSDESAIPPYYIFSGLVFTVLCEEYLKEEYGEQFDFLAPTRLLEKHLFGFKTRPNHQVVILSQVLAHNSNVGYEYLQNIQVIKCNGVDINNLEHFVTLIETCQDEFIRLDLDYDEIVILDRKEGISVTKDVLAQNSIPAPMSPELLKKFPQKAVEEENVSEKKTEKKIEEPVKKIEESQEEDKENKNTKNNKKSSSESKENEESKINNQSNQKQGGEGNGKKSSKKKGK
eukprot:c20602_g1_i2.p1 GENE.c20602_g1_i2~~c20602_g1_i2.p1  ORF type:complete len:619 (+),score=230.11 c20602_g1_i2:112-1968(+)